MSNWAKLATVATLFFGVVSGDAKPRVRLAGVAVGGGYTHFSGFYPYFGYPSFYGPLFYAPALYPGFYNGFAYAPNLGEVRLRTTAKAGEVYLDGAYAGEIAKLRHIWLEPGAYNLSVQTEGRATFERRIYVLSGKTLDLQPTGAAIKAGRP